MHDASTGTNTETRLRHFSSDLHPPPPATLFPHPLFSLALASVLYLSTHPCVAMTRLETRSGRSISISSLSTESDVSGIALPISITNATADESVLLIPDTDYIVPTPGTYVVFQLDPVQMVAPLDDPELNAAAVKIQPKKYVGYVYEVGFHPRETNASIEPLCIQVHELTLPDNPDHKCCIELVGKGICKEDEDALVDRTMCTPVFPAKEHPLSRRPLRPKPSFPFTDCYHYTFATPVVRIPTKNHPLANAVTLPEHDFMADSLYVCEDRRARRTLRRAREQQLARRPSSPQAESEGSSHAVSHPVQPTDAVAVGQCKLTSDSNGDGVTDSGIGESPATELLDLTRPSPSSCPSNGVLHSAQPRSRVHSTPSERGEQHIFDISDGTVLRPPDMQSAQAGSSRPVLSLETQLPIPTEEITVRATPDDRTRQDQPSEVEVLDQFLRPNHFEDRDMIPLVDVSVDLSEVSEVDDPLEFLQEIKQIQRSVLLHSLVSVQLTVLVG